MKNSIPQSQVIWVHVIAVIYVSTHVIAVIYTSYLKQNKFGIHSNTSWSKYVIQKDYFIFGLLLTDDILLSSNVKHNKDKYLSISRQ